MRTFQILHQVDLALHRTETGLLLVRMGNYSQGMYDLVIHGRSITNILQKLRGTEPDFDEWYIPFRTEMENDELMKFFYKLRSTMLKEGTSPVSAEIGFEPFDMKKVQEDFPKPPNATKFVLSSKGEDSYYEVKNPDGSLGRVPVDFRLKTRLVQRFSDAPKTHLGENIEGETADQMAERFVVYLRNLISEAHRRFDKMRA